MQRLTLNVNTKWERQTASLCVLALNMPRGYGPLSSPAWCVRSRTCTLCNDQPVAPFTSRLLSRRRSPLWGRSADASKMLRATPWMPRVFAFFFSPGDAEISRDPSRVARISFSEATARRDAVEWLVQTTVLKGRQTRGNLEWLL